MSFLHRWRKFLEHASRSRSFLWKLAIGCILGGVAIGSVLHHWRPATQQPLQVRILAALTSNAAGEIASGNPAPGARIFPAFESELADPGLEFRQLVYALSELAPLLAADVGRSREILQRRFAPEEADITLDFIRLFAPDSTERTSALQRLHAAAAGDPAVLFANHLLGMHELLHGRHEAAAGHFAKEGLRSEAVFSRRMAMTALISGGKFAGLDTLVEDSRYAALLTPFDRLESAIARQDWPAIFQNVPLTQIISQRAGLLALTLLTGAAWAFFLFHLGQVTKFFSSTTVLCLAAFMLGALSTTPTIYLVIWQEDILQFSAVENSLQTLAYNIGGVGLREELCKLLLFLPLLPFLLKRGDEREVLLVASFAGLGFAIEENGSYFLDSQGADAPGRFLTANFLHIALTGLNGLALFRAFTRKHGLNEFLTVFPMTILIHGLYDGLPDLPELMEIGGYLAITLYVVTSVFYFNRAHELRENLRMTLGLTGAFIFALSVVAAAVIVEQTASFGTGSGLQRIFPAFLSVGVMVLMFLRVFDEGLTD